MASVPYRSLARGDVDYIMEIFPIVKRKDEQKYREYCTKRSLWKYTTPCSEQSTPANRTKLVSTHRPPTHASRIRGGKEEANKRKGKGG